MTHHCQICAMPMFSRREMGTNTDGTTNPDYCCNCYRGGHFTDEQRAYNGLNTFGAPFSSPFFWGGAGGSSFSGGFPQFMSPDSAERFEYGNGEYNPDELR